MASGPITAWQTEEEKVEVETDILFSGSKITADHDYMDHGRVTSLLFNTLSRFVIVFLKRSNCLLISLLQSPSTVILEPKKRKSVTTSTFSPSICHEVMGPDAMILVFFFFNIQF